MYRNYTYLFFLVNIKKHGQEKKGSWIIKGTSPYSKHKKIPDNMLIIRDCGDGGIRTLVQIRETLRLLHA